MRRLELDFQCRRRASWAGWAVLGCGLIAAGVALFADHRIGAETALHQSALRRVEGALPAAAVLSPASPHRGGVPPAADMERVHAQLNLPWGQLFAVLESLAGADVALLLLAPDARKREVRIAGEARNLAAMLAFHRKLEDSGPLRDVSLLNHEFAEQVPGRPVRFSLVAVWTLDDAHP